MPGFRVLITAQTFRRVPGDHQQKLLDAGCELIDSPYPRAATEDELLPLVRDVDAVVASTDAFTRRVVESADRLKIISRSGVGFDAIDCDAAAERGLWVTVTPGTNELSGADAPLAVVLARARLL